MRISTGTFYDLGVEAITSQQAAVIKTQQQVSSGHRLLAPSDDPVAAAQILQVTQAQSINKQYTTNQGVAQDLMGQTDSVLQQIRTLLQDVRVTAVDAGNPVLTNQDRASMALDVQGRLDELISLANSKDSNGNYLFSGLQGATQAFSKTASGVVFNGDEGQRLVQVSSAQQLAVTENGANVFMRVKNGNGVFTTGAASTNAGDGTIDGGLVVAPSSLTGHNYQIAFTVIGGATSYSITDTTSGTTVNAPAASGNPYTASGAISFDGLQVQITGAPGNGDKFTVSPSTNQSVFTSVQNLVTTLNTPINGNSGKALLTNGLGAAMRDIDLAIDKTLNASTSLGTRERELDVLGSAASNSDLQYSTQISALQDIDYNKAISDLNRQQVSLQAAQQSFVKISGKSLFDFL